jgi:hypothetical protein
MLESVLKVLLREWKLFVNKMEVPDGRTSEGGLR